MKWHQIEDNERAAQRMNNFFNNVFAKALSNKAIYALFMLALFMLISGAGSKWRP